MSGSDEEAMLLTKHIHAAMRHANYEILEDDGTFYGSIRGFQGVWANAPVLELCREELQEALEDWIMYRLANGLELPVVENTLERQLKG